MLKIVYLMLKKVVSEVARGHLRSQQHYAPLSLSANIDLCVYCPTPFRTIQKICKYHTINFRFSLQSTSRQWKNIQSLKRLIEMQFGKQVLFFIPVQPRSSNSLPLRPNSLEEINKTENHISQVLDKINSLESFIVTA